MANIMTIAQANKHVAGTPDKAILAKYAKASAGSKAVLFDAMVARAERSAARREAKGNATEA